MGFGNTKKAFDEHFYPLVKAYKYGSTTNTTTDEKQDTQDTSGKTKYLRVLKDVNMHKTPDFNSESVCGEAKAGTALTIVKRVDVKDSKTDMYLVKSGVYITASTKYVEVFEK